MPAISFRDSIGSTLPGRRAPKALIAFDRESFGAIPRPSWLPASSGVTPVRSRSNQWSPCLRSTRSRRRSMLFPLHPRIWARRFCCQSGRRARRREASPASLTRRALMHQMSAAGPRSSHALAWAPAAPTRRHPLRRMSAGQAWLGLLAIQGLAVKRAPPAQFRAVLHFGFSQRQVPAKYKKSRKRCACLS